MLAERLFVAVQLTEEARRKIATHIGNLPGRLVPPENWHFTLRFLGNTSPAARDSLISIMRQSSLGGPFPISFGSLGAFPRAKRARIVWIGVNEGSAQLISLAEKIEHAARQAVFPAESRPFQPHLTLSRVDPPRSVVDVVTEHPPIAVSMNIHEVTLVRSLLGGGPSRYEVIDRFPLERKG
ncbi:MAG TPA: RNA 2',3'-cyclic phosphodiesterase [Gemmatimonadaceae bacterium]|nr:RNA 2',3'-cyclic phosphodiesterase [Gemmatimonadaceae bacterium]